MKLTDSHRHLLRLVGSGQQYWDVFNAWQAARNVPVQFFRPERTFELLERKGLVVLDDETIKLTELGKQEAGTEEPAP